MIPKRTFWATMGYGAGVASTVYLRRRVRRAVGPRGVEAAAIARGAASGVRSAAVGVKTAVSDGRAAMRATEASLRAEYGLRTDGEARPQVR